MYITTIHFLCFPLYRNYRSVDVMSVDRENTTTTIRLESQTVKMSRSRSFLYFFLSFYPVVVRALWPYLLGSHSLHWTLSLCQLRVCHCMRGIKWWWWWRYPNGRTTFYIYHFVSLSFSLSPFSPSTVHVLLQSLCQCAAK